MNIQLNLLKGVCLFLLVFTSCIVEQKQENLLEKEIGEIKKTFAPDKRVALFDIIVDQKGDVIVLKGESNLPDAVTALKEKLSENNKTIVDSIQLLPAANLEGKTQGVINISVANLRSNPKHSAELATQATLGTPVVVLKKEGNWYYIQTPDKYLSWVDDGGITLMNAQRFEAWRAGDKIIYTKIYGHSYNAVDEKEVVSDLVAGDVLEFVKLTDTHFVTAYP